MPPWHPLRQGHRWSAQVVSTARNALETSPNDVIHTVGSGSLSGARVDGDFVPDLVAEMVTPFHAAYPGPHDGRRCGRTRLGIAPAGGKIAREERVMGVTAQVVRRETHRRNKVSL